MMSKIDLHHYQCVREFMNDIDQITANALEYNPDKDPQSKIIKDWLLLCGDGQLSKITVSHDK